MGEIVAILLGEKTINLNTWAMEHANRGLRDRNSPTCTLSQNGYGVWEACSCAQLTPLGAHGIRGFRLSGLRPDFLLDWFLGGHVAGESVYASIAQW
jgi:hypothetical protein